MPRDQALLDKIRAARRKLEEAGPSRQRRPGDFGHVTLPNQDADVLRDVLVAEQADVVIEIGLAYGVSALAIAEALATTPGTDSKHIVIDAFQDHFQDAGWDAIVGVGAESICTLLRERSQLALARLVSEGFVADAAFVDGSHVFHNVFADLVFLRDLVHPGGLILLDDCNVPSVGTAVRYFELNAGWLREPMKRQTRLQAYRLPNPRVEPSFEGFVPFS